MSISLKAHKSATNRRNERGSAVVEAALVFPVFLMILWGIVGFGVDLGLQQSVTHAASEAARDSISAPSLNTGETNCLAWTNSVTTSVQQALNWLPSIDRPVIWNGTGTAPSSYFQINFLDSSYNTGSQCPTTASTASGTTYVQVKLLVPTILPHFPGLAPSSIKGQGQVQVQ